MTVSKETTFLTAPLTKDGFVDYAGVINWKMAVGVTANNNAVVQFYRAHGPAPEGNLMPERFFQQLASPRCPQPETTFSNPATFYRVKGSPAETLCGMLCWRIKLSGNAPVDSRGLSAYRQVAGLGVKHQRVIPLDHLERLFRGNEGRPVDEVAFREFPLPKDRPAVAVACDQPIHVVPLATVMSDVTDGQKRSSADTVVASNEHADR